MLSDATHTLKFPKEESKSISQPLPVKSTKLVEFYCRVHTVSGCGALDHVSCKAEYIPDISLEYKARKSTEYFTLI